MRPPRRKRNIHGGIGSRSYTEVEVIDFTWNGKGQPGRNMTKCENFHSVRADRGGSKMLAPAGLRDR